MSKLCGIFDFDGTLFDSMYVWDDAAALYLRTRGIEGKPTLREDVRALSLWQTALFFQREYGLALPAEEIMEGVNRVIEARYLREVMPKPGVREFLSALRQRGIPLCVATATDRYLIEAALARCGLSAFFEEIFTCGEVGHGKDEPAVYRAAAERFGLPPRQCLVFEDALHAARTAGEDGFTVVGVGDPSEKHPEALRELADVYLEDFLHTGKFWEFLPAL